MKILVVEKFYRAWGGVGTYLALAEDVLSQRGHVLERFGCVDDGHPPEMPAYHDFAQSRWMGDVWRMIRNRQAATCLDAVLTRHRPDVAFVHNIYHHLTPSIFPVLAARGVPAVMMLHDYRLACPTKHFLRSDGVCTRCGSGGFFHAAGPRCAALGGLALAIESYWQRWTKAYVRGVDTFICPTNFMQDVMIRVGLPKDKTTVVRNFVGPVQLPDDVTPQDNHVLYVGRLSSEKGPELLLELAARLPSVTVTVSGDGPMAEMLKTSASGRGIDNLRLLGHVDRDDLPRLLAAASVVVMTSRCFENSPMSLLEAMGAGKCVVVPDHPPLREWVVDRQSGRTFAANDADDLARVVGEVLNDGSGREAMGACASELIARQHDTDQIGRELEDLFTRAVARCESQ